MCWFYRLSGYQPVHAGWLDVGRRAVPVWTRVMVMLGVLMVWTGAGLAADPGSIQGLVQRGGQGVAEHGIMLIRFGPDQDVQRTPGQTDAQGRFVFENLDTGDAFTYVVGIRSEGQLYRSESITLEAGERRTGVVVEVRQAAAQTPGDSASQPPLYIAHHLMRMALREDRLEVGEIVTLRNTGATPYTGTAVPPGHAAFSLYLPLPQGYSDLRNVQGLEAEHVGRHPSGLFYTAPLDPGEHRVGYEYSLPFPDNTSVVFIDRTLPTAVFDVFIEEAHLVAASDLQFGGRFDAPPHVFLRFRGTDLAAHTRSRLQLTRLTAPTPLLEVGAYGVIVGMALLGIAIPLYGVWRGRAPLEQAEPLTPAQNQELQAARVRLLQTIARLDDEREAGGLDQDTYQQRRRTYKTQLIELVEHLHYNQQHKEDSS